MKNKTSIAGSIAAIVPAAQAVTLNPHGTGQVLIYPYYTANAGYVTLLTLGNDTNQSKALKLRFHEGTNGRAVLGFNIYLAPGDVWTGGVFAASDGRAGLVSDDPSCTVPLLNNANSPTKLPDGRPYVAFRDVAYTGARADSGPTGPERTREGHVEVIEMGELVGASAEATYFLEGTPQGCDQLLGAWNNGGYWRTLATTDLTPPGGGLWGSASIVNVANGTLFGYAATAIDGFSVKVQHTFSDDVAHPSLADAVTDTATGIASAFVPVGNTMVRADYPANRAIDAVSAVLATASSAGETIWAEDGSAATEWILSAPTKRFYVDKELFSSAVGAAPFGVGFGDEAGRACQQVHQADFTWFGHDRDADALIDFGTPAPRGVLCFDTSVVSFSSAETPTTAPSPLFGSANHDAWFGFKTGFSGFSWNHQRNPANGGQVFKGLPVIGLQATNFYNANVTPGVLSNYGALYPLRGNAVCTKDGGDC